MTDPRIEALHEQLRQRPVATVPPVAGVRRAAVALRWRDAVNHWGKLGHWYFHVCRDPQMLGGELQLVSEGRLQP